MTPGAIYLNGATLMSTPTPRLLEVARIAGYAGIEARAERLLGDKDELRETAAAAPAGSIFSLNGVSLGLDRESLERDLDLRLAVCVEIGAAYLLAVAPRAPGVSAESAIPAMRDGLELAGEAARRSGVRVAFEFLGFRDCPINTPALAGEVVEGLHDIELVLDSCHWYAGGARPLDGFPVERLALVHLNDAPAKKPDELEDADRVFPGDGVIPLADLISDLRSRGYAGPWSLETFNPSYWAADPEAVARRGLAAVEPIVGRGGGL